LCGGGAAFVVIMVWRFGHGSEWRWQQFQRARPDTNVGRCCRVHCFHFGFHNTRKKSPQSWDGTQLMNEW